MQASVQQRMIVILSFANVSAFAADSINIDIGDQGEPGNSYRSASEQIGTWNSVAALDTPVALVDVSGAGTGASVTVSASSLADEALAYSTDEERLYGDRALAIAGAQWTVTVTGLESGEYDVFYYAANQVASGAVVINGLVAPSLDGNSFPPYAAYNRGLNFEALQGIPIADGQMTISGQAAAESPAGISGLQIIPHRRNEPEPYMLITKYWEYMITEIDETGQEIPGPAISPSGQNAWAWTGGNIRPMPMAWSPTGDLLVGYWDTSRVHRFSQTGEHLGIFASVSRPQGMAYDSDCNLFVTGFTGGIFAFDTSGSSIAHGLPVLHEPAGIVFDSKDDVYITQRTRANILKYDRAGNFLGELATAPNPIGITVDADDNVFFVDYSTNAIRKFDADMNDLGTFATTTERPLDVVIGPDGDIYATTGSTIESWMPDGTSKGVVAQIDDPWVPDAFIWLLMQAPPPPSQLVELGDINANGFDDIAALRPGSIIAEVRDGENGSPISTIGFLDENHTAVDAVVLPDLDGNGSAELAVLAVPAARACAGRAVVEIRNLIGDESPRRIWFAQDHTPIAMRVIEDDADDNGVVELAVLSKRRSDGRGLVEVKNAFGPTNPRALWAGSGLSPSDLEIVPDADANGVPEVAILSTRDADGRIVVELKNAAGPTNPNAVWFMPGNTAIDLAAVGDKDANAIPEIAVLSTRDADGRNVVEIKNASGATNPSAVWFSPGYTATEVTEVADADNNGIPEVAVLGTRDTDNRILVEMKNVFGATNPNLLWYSVGFGTRDMATISDTDGDGADEAIVLMVRDSDGRILVQGRNMAGDPGAINFWFSP